MSRIKVLPDDVKQVCIHIVKGYERRVQDYNERRTAFLVDIAGSLGLI